MSYSFNRRMAVERAADRAAPIFELMGWTWAGEGVPSQEEIEEHLRGMVETVVEGRSEQPHVEVLASRYGRFEVRRQVGGPGPDQVTISLELEAFPVETVVGGDE